VTKVANTARTELKDAMANGQQYNYNTRRNGQWATVQTTKCRRYTRKRRKRKTHERYVTMKLRKNKKVTTAHYEPKQYGRSDNSDFVRSVTH